VIWLPGFIFESAEASDCMYRADWVIMFAPLLVVAIIGIYTRRYVKSVADFMAGGRNAGRYLMCTARSGMGGAVTFVAANEYFPKSGFVLGWWGQLWGLVGLLTAIYGFVSYRFRQTRAMTLAQFFEMRYSRRFRLFLRRIGICRRVDQLRRYSGCRREILRYLPATPAYRADFLTHG